MGWHINEWIIYLSLAQQCPLLLIWETAFLIHMFNPTSEKSMPPEPVLPLGKAMRWMWKEQLWGQWRELWSQHIMSSTIEVCCCPHFDWSMCSIGCAEIQSHNRSSGSIILLGSNLHHYRHQVLGWVGTEAGSFLLVPSLFHPCMSTIPVLQLAMAHWLLHLVAFSQRIMKNITGNNSSEL